MSFNIPSIKIGTSATKRYTRSSSFDNNTTLPFGVVQPLMSERLEGSASIKVGMRQLLRLSPLICPSFARVHLQNEVSFVPMADVCPYYEAFLKQQYYSPGSNSATVTSYLPKQLPYTSNSFLLYLILTQYAYYSVWSRKPTDPDTTPTVDTESTYYTLLNSNASWDTVIKNQQKNFLSAFVGLATSSLSTPSSIPLLNPSYRYYSGKYDSSRSFEPTPLASDYVVRLQVDSAEEYCFCFNLTSAGKRLRQNLIGLGYSLEIGDSVPLSILPILSYYKAYYDLYAPSRVSSWTQTDCYDLIQYINNNYVVDFCISKSLLTTSVIKFNNVIKALAQTWYSQKDDFVSIHRSTPSLTPAEKLKISSFNGSFSTVTSTANQLPYAQMPTNLDLVRLQALQKLTRFVNKDSIIGQKMSDWVRVHFGTDISNSLFKQSYHIHSSRLDCQINDVLSTSDTSTVDSDGNRSGEVLGAYAGKGIGYDNNGFKFTAPCPGYLFVLSSVVPESGYYQGTKGDLYCVDLDTVPFPEFDALGFEATSVGMIRSQNDISGLIHFNEKPSFGSSSFGFVPRYTGLKVHKNIVNGDMSLRSTISSNSPYYLDRILTGHYCQYFRKSTDSDGTVHATIKFGSESVPTASESWRYPTRYSWLGNFNRIFVNMGVDTPSIYRTDSTDINIDDLNDFLGDGITDNFILQTNFDVSIKDWMKPISESFDTFEESTDNHSVSVEAD